MTMINTVLDQVARMDNDELNQVLAAIKLQRTAIAKTVTRKLLVGDVVSFDTKHRTITGVVRKVNPKTVLVRDHKSATTWKVTATLLTPLSIGN